MKIEIKKRSGAPEITVNEAQMLLDLQAGADIYNRILACAIRELQKRGYITDEKAETEVSNPLGIITKAAMPPKNGAEAQPYFGFITTAFGKAIARAKMLEDLIN